MYRPLGRKVALNRELRLLATGDAVAPGDYSRGVVRAAPGRTSLAGPWSTPAPSCAASEER
jgi:hypothetical protein